MVRIFQRGARALVCRAARPFGHRHRNIAAPAEACRPRRESGFRCTKVVFDNPCSKKSYPNESLPHDRGGTMNSPRKSLVAALATSALAVIPLTDTRLPRTVDRSGQTRTASYTSQQKEFWLTEDEITYVRPGFHITVNSITIGADRKPVADLSFTDDLNQPLDRL